MHYTSFYDIFARMIDIFDQQVVKYQIHEDLIFISHGGTKSNLGTRTADTRSFISWPQLVLIFIFNIVGH